MNTLSSETKFLESLFENYIKSSDSSYLRLMRELMIRKCVPYIPKNAIAVEFGCEIGYMTSLISPLVKHLDVIEGSESFMKEAKKRNLENVDFHLQLFEEFDAQDKYDCAFASHVIEHLIDPQAVLKAILKGLKPGGCLFITVPNARAASRQLAQRMGLLDDLYALTPNDVRGGHRRVYNKDQIWVHVELSGFTVVETSGILFKPFCDFQMDYLIDSGFLQTEHLEGLYELGKDFKSLCGDIFICAQKA